MERMTDLQIHDDQVRRLRTEYAGDPLVRLLVELDVAIRHTANRVRSLVGDDPAPSSESQ